MNDFRILAHFINDASPTFPPRPLQEVPRQPPPRLHHHALPDLATSRLTEGRSRPILNRFGLNHEIIQDAHFWRIMTPLFIQPSPGIGWKMVLLVTVACTSLELLGGSVRSIVTFFVSDWSATVLTSSALAVLSRLGIDRATAAIYVTDAGTSAATVRRVGGGPDSSSRHELPASPTVPCFWPSSLTQPST